MSSKNLIFLLKCLIQNSLKSFKLTYSILITPRTQLAFKLTFYFKICILPQFICCVPFCLHHNVLYAMFIPMLCNNFQEIFLKIPFLLFVIIIKHSTIFFFYFASVDILSSLVCHPPACLSIRYSTKTR